jgi:hypothetical protein
LPLTNEIPFSLLLSQDDTGLKIFHDEYFPFPLYKDINLNFYFALGNGSIMDHISYNPFKIWRGLKKLGKRLRKKGLDGNYVGDGVKTGGIIIFGSDGVSKAANAFFCIVSRTTDQSTCLFHLTKRVQGTWYLK